MAYTYTGTPSEKIQQAKERISADNQAVNNSLSQYLKTNQQEQAMQESKEASLGERIGDTLGDIFKNVATGLEKAFEGIVDFGASTVGMISGWVGNESLKDDATEFVKRDLIQEQWDALGEKGLDVTFENSAINKLSETGQNIVRGVSQGVGQMLPMIATMGVGGALGVSSKVLQTANMVGLGLSASGTGTESALNDTDANGNPVSLDRAYLYGLAEGGKEVATELLVGGAVWDKGAGVLDKAVSNLSRNAKFSKLVSFGINSLGEGFEELVGEAFENTLQTIYKSEDGNIHWENPDMASMIENGVVGALTSAVLGVGQKGLTKASNTLTIKDSMQNLMDNEEYAKNMQDKGNFDEKAERRYTTERDTNLQKISDRLSRMTEEKRLKQFKSTPQLAQYFDEKGKIKTTSLNENVSALENTRESVQAGTLDARIGDYNKVANTTSEMSNHFNENIKVATEVDTTQKENLNTLKKLNSVVGKNTGMPIKLVVVESDNAKSRLNASILGDTMYVTKEVLSDKNRTIRAFAHENSHFNEDTQAHKELIKYIEDEAPEVLDKAIKQVTSIEEYTKNKDVYASEIDAHIVEYFIDSNQEVIDKLISKNESLGKKILAKIKDTIKAVKSAFKGGEEYAEYKRLKKAEELFENALKTGGVKELVKPIKKLSEETLRDYGIVEDEKIALPQYSLDTWNELDKDTYVNALVKSGVAKNIDEANKYINDINGIASIIATDKYLYDYEQAEGTSVKDNAEYGASIDFSTLCAKRIVYTATLDKIVSRTNKPLTIDEMIKIREMLSKAGDIVACAFCYVESQRKFLYTKSQEFIDNYKPDGDDKYIPTMEDLTTQDGKKRLQAEHPVVWDAYLKVFNKLGQAKPRIVEPRVAYGHELIKSGWSKASVDKFNRNGGLRWQSFSDFESINLIDGMQLITDMAIKGLSGQAYTKVPNFALAFGNTGFKINLSIVGKDTGIDADGNLIFDDIEGMPIKEALKLRKRFSENVGTVLVGINEKHILKAMESDIIDYIIPYHRSSWSYEQMQKLGIGKYVDFTEYQTEKIQDVNKYRKYLLGMGKKATSKTYIEASEGKNIDATVMPKPIEYWDFTKSGDENTKIYINLCEKYGIKPKFADKFLYDENGNIRSGYWKLIIDFKMYDNDGKGSPQKPVTPNFNMEDVQKVLYDTTDSHRVDMANDKVVDEFVSQIQYSIESSEITELNLEGIKYSIGVNINDSTQAFTEQILNGIKTIETRNTRTLDSYVGKRVGIVRTGKGIATLVGSCIIGKPKVYNSKESFDADYNKHLVGKNSKFYINDVKYGYPLLDVRRMEEIPVESKGIVSRKLADGIQFSTNTDSQGNQLTEEQKEYFKDSVVRDGNGHLKVVYRGAKDNSYTVMNKKFTYFTDNESVANTYGDSKYVTYLNITNPAVIDAKGELWSKIDIDKLSIEGIKDVKAFLKENGASIWKEGGKFRTSVADLSYAIKQSGNYDGLEIRNIYDSNNTKGEMGTDYITFEANQIKLVDNTKPTTNSDIRFSISTDSEGNKLSVGQEEFFKDSKVRDEEGNLMVMYEGTNAEFTKFDKNFIGRTGRFEGAGFNFTPSKARASSYGKNVMSGYLNIAHPLSANNKTISIKDLAKIIKEIDTTGDNIISNYAQDTFDYGKQSFINRESLVTAKIIWESAENDVDIYSELSVGNPDSLSQIAKFEELGYDGLIHYYDNGKIKTAVSFESNQFKNIDNYNPTSNEDIRYSISFDDYYNKNYDLIADMTAEEMSKWLSDSDLSDIDFTTEESLDEKYAREKANREDELTAKSKRTKKEVRQDYIEKLVKEGKLQKFVNKLVENNPKVEEFFKDSKVRDKNGNLKVMFHATTKEFNAFNPDILTRAKDNGFTAYYGLGFYFADSFNIKNDYGNIVNTVLLNVKKPMKMNQTEITKEQYTELINTIIDNKDSKFIEHYKTLEGALEDARGTDYYALDRLFSWTDMKYEDFYGLITKITGFDGIDINHKGWYVIFNPNQAKYILNFKPTTSSDMRYSISKDSDGHKLTEAQAEYFKDSKFRDGEGNLLKMYHGSKFGGFYNFNGYVFLTPFKEVAESYTYTKKKVVTKKFTDVNELVDFINTTKQFAFERKAGVIKDSKYILDSQKTRLEYLKRKAEIDKEKGKYEKLAWYYEESIKTTEDILAHPNKYYYVSTVFDDVVYSKKEMLGRALEDLQMDISSRYESDDNNVGDDGLLKRTTKANGIYELYANCKNPVRIKCRGFNFMGILNPFTHERQSTDDVVKYIISEKESGNKQFKNVDGVIFENVMDNGEYDIWNDLGASDVYVVFNSSQVKAVDNLNPTKKSDIRYSINTDMEAKVKESVGKIFNEKTAEDVVISNKTVKQLTKEFIENAYVVPTEYVGMYCDEFADKLLANVKVKNVFDTPEDIKYLEQEKKKLDSYRHKFTFSDAEKSELRYIYGDNKVLQQWVGKNGAYHTDTFVEELSRVSNFTTENDGIDAFVDFLTYYDNIVNRINAVNNFDGKTMEEADWGNEVLRAVKDDIRDTLIEAITPFTDNPNKLIDNKIKVETNKIKKHYKDKVTDFLRNFEKNNKESYDKAVAESNLLAIDVRKAEASLEKAKKQIDLLQEQLSNAKKYNKKVNEIIYLTKQFSDEMLKKHPNGTMLQEDGFRAIFKQFSKLTYRGDLAKKGARKVIVDFDRWYNEDNPILKATYEGETLYNPEVKDVIKSLLETSYKNEEIVAKPFTYKELENLKRILTAVQHLLNETDLSVKEGEKASIKEKSSETITKFNKFKDMIKHNKLITTLKKYVNWIIEPRVFIKSLFGYQDNYVSEAFDKITEGETKSQKVRLEILTPLMDFYKKNKDYKNSLSKEVTFMEKKITKAELISLYKYEKQPHSKSALHLTGFGMYDKNGVWKEYGILDDNAVKEMDNLLTEKDYEYIDAVEKAMKIGAEYQYNTDEEYRGISFIDLDTTDLYLPIKRSIVDFSKTSQENYIDGLKVDSAGNQSINKKRVNNRRRIDVRPIDTIVETYAKQCGMYTGLAIPIKNFERLLNFNLSANVNKPISLRNTIGETIGKDALDYISKLLNDIQGITDHSSSLSLFGKIRGGYAKFQLGANLKVIMSQMASYPTAFTDLKMSSMTKALTHKVDFKQMDEYSDWARVRNESGDIVRAEGLIDNVSKFTDIFTKPIQWSDRFTIGLIWNACKVEVESRHKGDSTYKYGSEANMKEASKLLEEVGRKTQPNYTTTERTQLQRNQNEFMKTLAMFTAVPSKQISRLVEAIGVANTYLYKKKKGMEISETESKQVRVMMAKTLTAVTLANIIYIMMGQLVKFIYDKDREDKDGNEISVFEDMLRDFASTTVGMFPIAKNLYGYFVDGYDLDNGSFLTGGLEDILSSSTTFIDLISNAVNGNITTDNEWYSALKTMSYGIGQVTGMPVRNIYNTIYGLTKRFDSASAYKMQSIFYSSKTYTNDLKQAIEDGDENLANTIVGLLMNDKGLTSTSDKINETIKELYSKGYQVLPKTISDSVSYDGETYSLSASQQKSIKSIYDDANARVEKLITSNSFKGLDEKVQAKAIKWIYDYYYEYAVASTLGLTANSKKILFAETMDVSKFSLAIASCSSLLADTDKDGNAISGTKKAKVQALLNRLSLSYAEKQLILAYLGYSCDESAISNFIKKLGFTTTQQKAFMSYI